MDKIQKFIFKIILIGEGGVGKTSIIKSHISKSFNLDYKPTMGASIQKKEMLLPEKNAQVIFNFWDIAGQTLFKGLRKQFFQGSDAVMLVYDVTRRDSFDAIEDWYKSIKDHTKRYKTGMLVANKVDLKNRVISEEEGLKKSMSLKKFSYIETSALTTQNVNKAFETIASVLLE